MPPAIQKQPQPPTGALACNSLNIAVASSVLSGSCAWAIPFGCHNSNKATKLGMSLRITSPYWTVRVTVVAWVRFPLVPVTVIV